MLTDISDMTYLMHTSVMFYMAVLFWCFIGGLFLLYLIGGIAGIINLLRTARVPRVPVKQSIPRPALHSQDRKEAA